MDNLTEKHNSIVEGVIWKQLLLFFFPILLGTFFQQLYNSVDAAGARTSSGVSIIRSIVGAKSIPITVSSRPPAMPIATAVCTESSVGFSFFAP